MLPNDRNKVYCVNYKKLSIHQTFISNDFILKGTDGAEMI